jgi:hypothetical protein
MLVAGDEVFIARETTSKYSKLRYECNMSVRLHYPKVFDGSSGID